MTSRLPSGHSRAGQIPFLARSDLSDSLAALVRRGASRSALASFLDALEEDDRNGMVRALSRRDLAKLYELAATADPPPVELSFLVPASAGARTAEWEGVNSLPLFRRFAKRFTRSADPSVLIGYNSGAAQRIVGPGYFTVTVRPGHPSELLFDYTRVPAEAPAGWPPVRSNEAGLSRWVFADLHDYVRPVGSHVAIGAAYRSDGSPRGQFFALARGDWLPVSDQQPADA